MQRIFWDDLEVGSAFWGDWVTVDPDEMLDYARRNDPQPFHVDAEAARTTPFGGLIASAGFTVTLWYRSLVPVLGKLAFLGGFEWQIRLPAPVRPNDRLRTKMAIAAKRPSSKPGRGYATVFHEIFNQDETVVFTCEATIILATRR